MNEEKLEEVSGLLEMQSSSIVGSKTKRTLRRMVFPLIQAGFFISSSLLGLAFGYWEKVSSTEYPYGIFGGISRANFWGSITLVGLGGGNLTLTITTKNKLGIDKLLGVIIPLINLGISFLSFFLIYHSVLGDQQGTMTMVPMYNVHEREE